MVPRLIHPVTVVVEQIDPAAQVLDATFREPIGAPTKITRTLRGQVNTRRSQAMAPTPAGNDPAANSDGHVVFEVAALAAQGVTLRQGDVIVSEGGYSVRHRITRLEPHGTYGGRHHLLFAYFSRED